MTIHHSELRPARVESLTGLRWWAAFAVFTQHMANLAPLPYLSTTKLGTYGVTFFFVLSGFVLTWSSSRRVTPTTFWVRRWARIYPAYFVALLLAIPVFYVWGTGTDVTWFWGGQGGLAWQKPFDVGIIILSVLVLQGWSRDPAVLLGGNPAGWTLTVEAFFYALHPGLNRLLWLMRSRGALIAAGTTIAVAVGYRIAVTFVPGVDGMLPVPILHLPDFVLGMCLAWALRCGWRMRVPPLAAYLTAAIVVPGLVLAAHYAPVSSAAAMIARFTNEILVVLCAFLVLTVAARDVRKGPSLLRRRGFVLLGELSYSFYLVHATVIYFLIILFGVQPMGWSNLGWYAVALVVALLLSAALHFWVERPLERRIRTWWDRRRDRRDQQRAMRERTPEPVADAAPLA